MAFIASVASFILICPFLELLVHRRTRKAYLLVRPVSATHLWRGIT